MFLPDLRTDSFNNDEYINLHAYTGSDAVEIDLANDPTVALYAQSGRKVFKLPEIPFISESDPTYIFTVKIKATGQEFLPSPAGSPGVGFYSLAPKTSLKPNEIEFHPSQSEVILISMYGAGSIPSPENMFAKVRIGVPPYPADGDIFVVEE